MVMDGIYGRLKCLLSNNFNFSAYIFLCKTHLKFNKINKDLENVLNYLSMQV